ncbi:glycerophosphodiester phosphodiesterase [Streptomyces sp. NPDC001941]|uniref:glycerophosphodiester phosphodiesterase n=1 Tax=Streptomyces sp. NPDC001941 TaxID=3154659 RepID=UPI00331F61FF
MDSDASSATATGRPWVVAHRGSSYDFPEHTLSAYEQAVDDGADALECDVRLTRDGHLVCVHDRTVDRTSDGRGTVSSMTLAELSALDFGSWKGPGHSAGVLRFEQLLELVVSASRPVGLHVETKHPVRQGGGLERSLVSLLRRYGLHAAGEGTARRHRVEVMSFSRLALHRLRALAPTLPRAYLVEHPLLGTTAPRGTAVVGPGIDLVRARTGLVARLHAAGHRVNVWTVDEPADVELCLRLGVDTIITNRPRQVLRMLSETTLGA